MKILNLRAYYYPEKIPGLRMLEDLCDMFEKNKITHTVITPVPTRGVDESTRSAYSEKFTETRRGGYEIIKRFPLFREGRGVLVRALRYRIGQKRTYRIAKKETDTDLVLAVSTPPTQGLLAAKTARRLGVPFIYNVQDLFPESAVNAGIIKKGGLLSKTGLRITDRIYRKAAAITVISETFKKNLVDRGVAPEKIFVIENWVDTDVVFPVKKNESPLFEELGIDREKFTVLYAGTLGRTQGAEMLPEAAGLLADEKDIQFVIFGAGECFESIKTAAEKAQNIKVLPLLPEEKTAQVYGMADIALITCKKGVGASSLPSKAASIMACGKPILAAFDEESELGRTLKASGAGMCVRPEDAAALAEGILLMKDKISKYDPDGIREYAVKTGSKQACLGKLEELIKRFDKQ